MTNFVENKLKKKLDFTRPTFAEPEIKIPCRDLTNRNHHQDSHFDESERSKNQSEKSVFADDEDTESEVSVVSAVTLEKVSVFLRLKPTFERIPELYWFDEETHNVILRANMMSVERQYTFSTILNQATDQATVYDQCVRPVLEKPFSSLGSVFATYGVSNSGKTYTILGESQSAGIVPRALTQIFTEYQNHIAKYPCTKVNNDQVAILNDAQVEAEVDATEDFIKQSRKLLKGKLIDDWSADIVNDHQFQPKEFKTDYQQVFVWVSFVEIYNEKMIDLFKPQKASFNPQLRIISNNRNSYVHGLTWLHVSSIETALELLQHGLRRVNYAATGLNAHSSRSHTIFTINMISECGSSYEFSSFKFCDLAGAERISKTGVAGDRLKEAGGINTSLLVLGRCLEAVQHNQKAGVKKDIVPVRESKLTFLLQSSLMGQEKFVMIVNMLPTVECFEENINVLHFGSIANKIVTKKTQARKFSRGSSRYTYFMQHAVNSPLKMNSSWVHNESYSDQSSMDLSFKRDNMSADELRHELKKKDTECDALRKIIEEKMREFLKKEQELRLQGKETQQKARDCDKEYYESRLAVQENYHKKKMDSQKSKNERQIKDRDETIQILISENARLKKKLGINEDDEIIDLGDDYEEYYEEDDEDDESVLNVA